ncbi:MAG: hypothetical protein JOY54_09360 [Acidobacteriaceae bacterium]|nr:hypothetical protein [Acidobacteriaceae bacterium]
MVTLGTLQERLLAIVKARLQNGEFTERGLARLLGISQPQVHHVLKGARRLQTELADRMMVKLGVTATQLLDLAEPTERSGTDAPTGCSETEQTRLRRLKKPPQGRPLVERKLG